MRGNIGGLFYLDVYDTDWYQTITISQDASCVHSYKRSQMTTLKFYRLQISRHNGSRVIKLQLTTVIVLCFLRLQILVSGSSYYCFLSTYLQCPPFSLLILHLQRANLNEKFIFFFSYKLFLKQFILTFKFSLSLSLSHTHTHFL